jgi:hypothetical protein
VGDAKKEIVVELRGKIVSLSFNEMHSLTPFVFICTAECGETKTLVPAAPGTEGMLYNTVHIADTDEGMMLHSAWIDSAVIEAVKERCERLIRVLSKDSSRQGGQLYTYGRATLRNAEINYERLCSLGGNSYTEPTTDPSLYDCVKLEQPVPEKELVGKIAFVEIPSTHDGLTMSGEYLITEQSDDSLYGVKLSNRELSLSRIRLEHEGQKLKILYVYDDPSFVSHFLNEMDEYATHVDEELATTASLIGRQLRISMRGQVQHNMAINTIDEVFASIGDALVYPNLV